MPSHFRAFFMEVEMYVSELDLGRFQNYKQLDSFPSIIDRTYRIILLSARLTMSSKLASNTFSPPF